METATPNTTSGMPSKPAAEKPWLLPLTICVAVVGLVVAGLMLWQNMTDTAQEETPAASVVVTNSGFSPATIHVKKDQVVTWTNSGPSAHSIVSDQTDGSGPVSDEPIEVGDSYSFVFDEPGTYAYHDQSNGSLKGVVIVE